MADKGKCSSCKYWQSSVRDKHGICDKHHRSVETLMTCYAGINLEQYKDDTFTCKLYEIKEEVPR